MILIPPDENAKVIRYGPTWGKKKWHLLKPTAQWTSVCGMVCLDPEYSTLGEVQDLCNLCWPYEKRKQKE